jgi:hypothetical protein
MGNPWESLGMIQQKIHDISKEVSQIVFLDFC